MLEAVGKYNKNQIHLFINDKVPPVPQKARRIPYKMREKVSNGLEMLRQQDIIEDVKDESTPWYSPIVLVPKIMIKLINICKEARFMNNAFLKFELDSRSREITTFTTHEGLHRFKRNFETNATSEILQRKMDKILENIPNCLAIADDVIVFAASFDAMYDALGNVLNRFLECGITLKKQKCKLFQI